MRKWFFGALLALIGLAAPAQAQKSISVPLFSDYDLANAGSYVYCITTGATDDVWGPWREVKIKVKTSGSSTTVTSNTASTSAFLNVAIGDELLVTVGDMGLLANGSAVTTTVGAETRRYVTARASADSITINSAVNWSAGYTFYFRRRVCSTTSSGWLGVQGLDSITFHFQIDQINATSIDAKVECRVRGSVDFVTTVWSKNYTAVGSDSTGVNLSSLDYDDCRLAMKLNTDGGAQKVTGYATADKR